MQIWTETLFQNLKMGQIFPAFPVKIFFEEYCRPFCKISNLKNTSKVKI